MDPKWLRNTQKKRDNIFHFQLVIIVLKSYIFIAKEDEGEKTLIVSFHSRLLRSKTNLIRSCWINKNAKHLIYLWDSRTLPGPFFPCL